MPGRIEGAPIEAVEVSAYTVPTEAPEADGTLSWDRTPVVVVEARAGGESGLGFTYGPAACGALVHEFLQPAVAGRDAFDIPGAWEAMVRAIRNTGRAGVASMAIAAVDTALWDLKARLLGLSLARLLGCARAEVPVYASGGFTSYDNDRLAEELGRWVHEWRIPRVKMKVASMDGGELDRDVERVRRARKAIGEGAGLYVDANGGYSVKEAIALAPVFAGEGVSWFEEPVSSDHLDQLRLVRDAIDIDVAAGEYAYDLFAFERLSRAVDVLQADASRCGGITEWLRAAAVAAAHGLEISGHTAQSLHVHAACAVPNLRHLEYFHDHHRVDRILFEGVLDPIDGVLRPDLSRPGVGLELKRSDAEGYRG